MPAPLLQIKRTRFCANADWDAHTQTNKNRKTPFRIFFLHAGFPSSTLRGSTVAESPGGDPEVTSHNTEFGNSPWIRRAVQADPKATPFRLTPLPENGFARQTGSRSLTFRRPPIPANHMGFAAGNQTSLSRRCRCLKTPMGPISQTARFNKACRTRSTPTKPACATRTSLAPCSNRILAAAPSVLCIKRKRAVLLQSWEPLPGGHWCGVTKIGENHMKIVLKGRAEVMVFFVPNAVPGPPPLLCLVWAFESPNRQCQVLLCGNAFFRRTRKRLDG